MSKEYIEKERVLQLLEENASDDEVFFAAGAIEAEPPADVKPVTRGGWRIYGDYNGTDFEIYFHTCSICGATGIPTFNFCPNCGADMRKEANDE